MGWQFIANVTPYQKQNRDNFIKERIKTQVGRYTKDARKTQKVVLSEQFREFYYNCVANQKVVFNYVYYTGKTEAELQAILNRVLATNKWISTDPYQMDGSCIFPSVSVMLGEFYYFVTVGLWCLNVTYCLQIWGNLRGNYK